MRKRKELKRTRLGREKVKGRKGKEVKRTNREKRGKRKEMQGGKEENKAEKR